MEFSKKSTSMSVLMFPWLGHGHISPFLELAKKLSHRKFEIYLCSTPANLVSVSPKIQSHSTNILLVELELPSLPNLPPKYHTTNGLPPNLMDTLKQAFDMSKPNFSNILKSFHPDLLIYDALQPWAQEEAAALDIPAVQFVTSSAVMTSMLFHAIYKPGNYFPFPNICFRDYEGEHVIRLRKSVVDHLEGRNPLTKSIEKSKDIILLKGVKEIDAKYSDYLTSLIGKKVVNVGTLVNQPVNDDKDAEVMKWLDTRKSGSTVLVSFGSEYFLSKQEFEEIANGLMLADKVNFIWVVRFPMGEKVKLEDVYPKGFYDKVGGRSLILHGWAPQAKILVHPSVGGFVSHCGWNSVVESMVFGVPIIAMPMHLDQPINARLVEDVGVGVEVRRNSKGMLERQEMARVIKKVMVEKGGERVRVKAKELGERIRAKEFKEPDDEFYQVVNELLKLKKST